ncbi:zinc finger protein Xfin-like [Oppia nitens]|uniref:zinc finger protein Xfin-like n=1 Tax=Oppia nitens TaxID=1686743 RepID=UPI0023D98D77|nr:zinc finger protein Xfin-like [Oppia nitens]
MSGLYDDSSYSRDSLSRVEELIRDKSEKTNVITYIFTPNDRRCLEAIECVRCRGKFIEPGLYYKHLVYKHDFSAFQAHKFIGEMLHHGFEPPIICNNCSEEFYDYTKLHNHQVESRHCNDELNVMKLPDKKRINSPFYKNKVPIVCHQSNNTHGNTLLQTFTTTKYSGDNNWPKLIQTSFACNDENCSKIFHTIKELNQHGKLEHGTCHKCDETFINQEKLDHHLVYKHNRDPKYHCITGSCDQRFCWQNASFRHLDTYSADCIRQLNNGRPKLPSDLLVERTKRLTENIMKTPKLDKQAKTFYCLLCERKFSSGYDLYNHKKAMHNRKLKSARKCDLCPEFFIEKGDLVLHRQLNHKIKFRKFPTSYRCCDCNKDFRSPKTLRDHKETHHGLNLFDCIYCNEKFSTKKDLDSHNIICRSVRINPETITLEDSDTSRETLSLTMNNGHRSPEYSPMDLQLISCQKEGCDEQFLTEEDLSIHVYLRHQPRYPCLNCFAKFDSIITLNEHERRQHGKTNFDCLFCIQSFGSLTEWEKHHNLCKPTRDPDTISLDDISNSSMTPYVPTPSPPLITRFRVNQVRTQSSVNTSTIKCDQSGCPLMFSSISKMVEHFNTHKLSPIQLPFNSTD